MPEKPLIADSASSRSRSVLIPVVASGSGAPTNDDGNGGEQGRGRGNAAQHPPGDAAALPEMILAGRRWKRAELAYLATAKPDLFVFCYLLIQTLFRCLWPVAIWIRSLGIPLWTNPQVAL